MHVSRERGQSMIEVIVASGIIMSAVASSLTLMASGVRASKASEAQITAGNLAREGIEVVRGIRDSNWLAGSAFDSGLVGTSNDYTGVPVFNPSTNVWTIDFTANAISDNRGRIYRYTNGPASPPGPVTGLMVQTANGAAPATYSSVLTNYRRLVTVDPLCLNGSSYTPITSGVCSTTKIGIRVTSTVQWTLANATKTLTIEERILDWR